MDVTLRTLGLDICSETLVSALCRPVSMIVDSWASAVRRWWGTPSAMLMRAVLAHEPVSLLPQHAMP